MRGQFQKLREVETQRREQLDELNQWYIEYETAQVALEDLKTKWTELPKVILPESSTASVFAYLNDLMRLDRSSIQFDFTFQREVKADGVGEEGEYGYGVYSVVGTGSFRDVYNLIWRIEHEKPLVKIASTQMQEQKVKEEARTRSEMQFEMVLHAYRSRRTMPMDGGTMAYEARDPFVGYNPFYPLVQEELPPNTEGLVEVEGAALEAMTADRVLVRDVAGRRATLCVGDRVYLGRLRAIQPDARRAVFLLNKGGIVDRVVLEMKPSPAALVGLQADERTSRSSRQASAQAKTVRFLGVEVARSSGTVQVIVRNTGLVPYRHFELNAPSRIVVDMEPALHAWDQKILKVEVPGIREIRTGQFKPRPPVVRIVIELEDRVPYTITQREGQIMVDIPVGESP